MESGRLGRCMGRGRAHGTMENATLGRILRIGNTGSGYLNEVTGAVIKGIELMGSNMGEELMCQNQGIGEKASGGKGSL